MYRTLTFFPLLLYVLWQAWNTFWEITINNSLCHMARPYGLNLHYKDSSCTWQWDALNSQNHSALWLRMIQAVFTVRSAATGLRICLTHTLYLKNVWDCASCHKPHYISAKCDVSRGAGSVPGWCCACVWLWVQVLEISCMNSSSEDINTQCNKLLYADAEIMCWGMLRSTDRASDRVQHLGASDGDVMQS